MKPVTLWRVHLKPGAEKGIDVPQFCLDRGIVGVGWELPSPPVSRDDYWQPGRQQFAACKKRWSGTVKPLLYGMAIDDLVWARSQSACYYLGRVAGEWEYRADAEHRSADIINVRRCEWQRVGEMDNVPGAVISSFIARRTAQRVTDPSALIYSRCLYARLRGEPASLDALGAKADLLDLLSAEDLEDVVAVYLQVCKRAILFPSTCKSDTKAIECVFTAADTGARIGLQVKRGNEAINQDTFSSFDGTVYLFQARGRYLGQPNERCVCLAAEDIRRFLFEHRKLMPGSIQRWLDFTGAG